MGWQGVDLTIDAKCDAQNCETRLDLYIYRFEADPDDTEWSEQEFNLEWYRTMLDINNYNILMIDLQRRINRKDCIGINRRNYC